mgnify:CR=1 FL=1
MATETGQTKAQARTSVVVAIAPTPPPVVTVPVYHGEMPEKFLGRDFKRW